MDEAQAEAQYERDQEAALEAEHEAAMSAQGQAEAEAAAGAANDSLYEDSGGDPNLCEFCAGMLGDSKPWKRGLDGAGAHIDCIPS